MVSFGFHHLSNFPNDIRNRNPPIPQLIECPLGKNVARFDMRDAVQELFFLPMSEDHILARSVFELWEDDNVVAGVGVAEHGWGVGRDPNDLAPGGGGVLLELLKVKFGGGVHGCMGVGGNCRANCSQTNSTNNAAHHLALPRNSHFPLILVKHPISSPSAEKKVRSRDGVIIIQGFCWTVTVPMVVSLIACQPPFFYSGIVAHGNHGIEGGIKGGVG